MNDLPPKSLLSQPSIIDRQPISVSANTPVAEAIVQMNQHRSSCLLVVESERLIGIFTERDLVKMTANNMAVENVEIGAVMTPNPITVFVSQVEDIFALISLFRHYRIRHLPVVDGTGKVAGIVTASTIREVLKPTDLLKVKRVEQVMTAKVIHALPTASVLEITQQMATNRISCVIIAKINNSEIFPIGIITERDIVQFRALELDLATIFAEQVMSSPLLPVKKSDSLWTAHQLMERYRIRRLVVVDDLGKLAGILTQSTILEALDPTEMQVTIEILRRQVDQKTAQLTAANDRLQWEVTQREQELRDRLSLEEKLSQQNILLQQALLKAEAASRVKSIFLANVSHELRTPLHLILGFVQLLEYSHNINAKERQYLTAIQDNGKHLLSLIDNLLETSHNEATRQNFIHQASTELKFSQPGERSSNEEIDSDLQQILTTTALSALPQELLSNLEQATVRGNFYAICQIIDKISPYNDSLAKALKIVVSDFQYATILDLIRKINYSNE